MTLAVGEHVTDILNQSSTQCNVEHLNATTNRQKGFVLSHCFSNNRKLKFVVLSNNAIDHVAAARLAIALRVNVSAALNQYAVTGRNEFCCLRDMFGKWRDRGHDSTGASHRLGVQHTV